MKTLAVFNLINFWNTCTVYNLPFNYIMHVTYEILWIFDLLGGIKYKTHSTTRSLAIIKYDIINS